MRRALMTRRSGLLKRIDPPCSAPSRSRSHSRLGCALSKAVNRRLLDLARHRRRRLGQTHRFNSNTKTRRWRWLTDSSSTCCSNSLSSTSSKWLSNLNRCRVQCQETVCLNDCRRDYNNPRTLRCPTLLSRPIQCLKRCSLSRESDRKSPPSVCFTPILFSAVLIPDIQIYLTCRPWTCQSSSAWNTTNFSSKFIVNAPTQKTSSRW